MKIRMLKLAAGPFGSLEAGRSYQVPSQISRVMAEELIASGAAVLVEREVERAVPPEPEKAVAAPARSNAPRKAEARKK